MEAALQSWRDRFELVKARYEQSLQNGGKSGREPWKGRGDSCLVRASSYPGGATDEGDSARLPGEKRISSTCRAYSCPPALFSLLYN